MSLLRFHCNLVIVTMIPTLPYILRSALGLFDFLQELDRQK